MRSKTILHIVAYRGKLIVLKIVLKGLKTALQVSEMRFIFLFNEEEYQGLSYAW